MHNNVLFGTEDLTSKVVASGSGNITIPSTTSVVQATVTIPHGLGTDAFYPQVWTSIGYANGSLIPYSTPDGGYFMWATVDATNLYISGAATTFGSPTRVQNLTFRYKLIMY